MLSHVPYHRAIAPFRRQSSGRSTFKRWKMRNAEELLPTLPTIATIDSPKELSWPWRYCNPESYRFPVHISQNFPVPINAWALIFPWIAFFVERFIMLNCLLIFSHTKLPSNENNYNNIIKLYFLQIFVILTSHFASFLDQGWVGSFNSSFLDLF